MPKGFEDGNLPPGSPGASGGRVAGARGARGSPGGTAPTSPLALQRDAPSPPRFRSPSEGGAAGPCRGGECGLGTASPPRPAPAPLAGSGPILAKSVPGPGPRGPQRRAHTHPRRRPGNPRSTPGPQRRRCPEQRCAPARPFPALARFWASPGPSGSARRTDPPRGPERAARQGGAGASRCPVAGAPVPSPGWTGRVPAEQTRQHSGCPLLFSETHLPCTLPWIGGPRSRAPRRRAVARSRGVGEGP